MTSQVLVGEKQRFAFGWMFGCKYDLLFYFLPLLFGIGCFLLSRSSPLSTSGFLVLVVTDAFGAGPFHWGPTWFAFFDRKNREYWNAHRSKQIVFFAGPLIVIAFSIWGAYACPFAVIFVTMIWGVQHLVQQNVGILLLYHNQKSGEAVVNRQIEVRSQQVPAIFFMAVFFWRVLLKQPEGLIYNLIGLILLVWALSTVVMYLVRLRKLMLGGASLNLPAFVFWMMSVCAMIPVAFFGKTFGEGFIIPVTIHWFQYIGLNYRLVQTKYGPNEPEVANLPKLAPIPLFMCTCAVWVIAVLIIHALLSFNLLTPILTTAVTGIYMSLASIHYLHDAFLWRFREPYVRQSILPYLMRARQSRSS